MGIDSGGGFFKVCLNLIDESPKPNAPGNSKKRKKRHLDSSVCKSFIVACVESIPEVYENVKLIMDKLQLGTEKLQFHLASDLKLINIIVGIQSHSATYPCPYCEWLKGSDGKGDLRDLLGIR